LGILKSRGEAWKVASDSRFFLFRATVLFGKKGAKRKLPRLLTKTEVRVKLSKLRGWRHQGSFIVKTYHFEEFMEGIRFLNKVVKIAESYQHHPDINVRYTTVRLSIQTHSEGGVTAWDIGLARAIDRLGSDT
jgi:4a-hydroxytetrahydrobiopterin dehydratase